MAAPRHQGRIERLLRRREFIALLGTAAAAWPLSARAQTHRLPRVGVLMSLPENDPETKLRVEAFQQGLRELGLQDGRNIHIDYRWDASTPDRAARNARELIHLKSDVIVGVANPGITVLRQETRTIPIVFMLIADPVAQGFAETMARPGGNMTGFTSFESSLGGKWLEILKEIAPRVARVALLFNPDTVAYSAFVRSVEAAAPSFAVQPIATPVHRPADIEEVINSFAREPNGALVVLPDTYLAVHRQVVIDLATRHGLPAVCGLPYFAKSGGLVSYGPDLVELFRRAPAYVDLLLKGAKPGDLPVQQPTRFQLAINLKTAKALGLTIPESFLLRADEVIE